MMMHYTNLGFIINIIVIIDLPDGFSESIADSELVRHRAERCEQIHRLVAVRAGRKEVEQSSQEDHLHITHTDIH